MIQWEVTDDGIRVADNANNELVIKSPDWKTGGTAHDVPRTHDAIITGKTSELRFPSTFPYIKNLDINKSYEFGNETGPKELPASDYLINLNQSVKADIRFNGTVKLSKTEDLDTFIISFPQPTQVTLAFRSRIDRPKHTITTPPTTDGLAKAIPYMATAHERFNSDRSFFEFRRHPPLLELGEEFDAPDTIENNLPDTGIELVVPDEMAALFVSAPLAYYLRANVRTSDEETPTLRAPSVNLEKELRPLPDFQHDCASLLKRVFSLDCLVRNVGPYETDLYEARLLDEVDIDTQGTYNASPAEQLKTYLSVSFEEIEDDLPDWHLSMYVEPEIENVSSLPFLLNTLSFIYLPKISDLEPREFMHRSLDDFYRGKKPRPPTRPIGPEPVVRSSNSNSVPSIDLVKPELYQGRVHGWLADEVPIDVFKTIPESYKNRLDYLGRDRDDTQVTVVLNDENMDAEHATVEQIYKERSRDLPFEVSIREHLSRRELASVFEAENDFVHYIGHCEESGLQCSDGYLSMADIEESNTQTFFLNACGSYYEGIELIQKGSVAGAVTFKTVLNKQAAKVGTAFARLLINGFSIERAVQLARRRIMMGKDYAVVGDGTHVLTQCDTIVPTTMRLEPTDKHRYRLVIEMFSARENGTYYQPYVKNNQKTYLFGTECEFSLMKNELLSLLNRSDGPVVYDGEFYWCEELYKNLS